MLSIDTELQIAVFPPSFSKYTYAKILFEREYTKQKLKILHYTYI